MPTVQNAFPIRQDAGIVGDAAMSHYKSDTGMVETAAGIGYGQPVMRGANDRGIALLAAAGAAFLGITRRDKGRPIQAPTGVTGGDLYTKGAPAAYFVNATGVFVLADAAVVPDAAVYWNPATGRYSSVSTGGNVACTGWAFDTTATAAGQLVIIKR